MTAPAPTSVTLKAMARRGLMLLLLALTPLAGCADGAPHAQAAEPALAETPAADASESDAPVAASRMVIRRAELHLSADSPETLIATASRLAERVGGYVSASTTSAVGDRIQQVDATLRVPSDRFEAVLDNLRGQGELLHQSLSGEDVTDQHTDLSARLRSKRALEERLLAILGKVNTVEDALKVEAELTEVRTEIERLDGTKQNLEKQVAMATIQLSVSSPVIDNPADAESVASRLDRALDDAGRAFIFVLGGLIRLFGVIIPLGVVAVPIVLGARHAWHRRRGALPSVR